ncbi:MAG: autotransporter-associated beta strand repeat-containing protein [Tepidisphaeraceae bacterium]
MAIATGGILLVGTKPDTIGPASGNTATLTSNNGSDLIVLAQTASSVLTVNYNIVNSSSGLNSNVIGLTKAGPGMLVLNGNNTYTGPTVIHAGTVRADNATRSLGTNTTTVRGGTLAGVGQTGGAVVVEKGGTISAGTGSKQTTGTGIATGDTVGRLSTGNQTWNGGGTYAIKFHDNSGVAGTSYDQLSMGTLNLSQLSSTNKFNLVLTQAANSTFTTPAIGTKFTIALASGGTGYIAGSNITDLFYLSSSDVGISDTSLFSVTVGSQGGSLMLSYGSDTQSAPEPHTLLLSGMASSVLLVRRRNKVRPLN